MAFGSSDNEVKVKVNSSADNTGIDKARKGIDDLTDSSDKAHGKLGALSNAAFTAGKVIGAAGLAAVGASTAVGLNFNSSVEQAQTKLMAFMKDGTKVAETLAWVKDEAAKTQFTFTDMADAAAQLTPTANITGIALKDLMKQAEILAAINPAEGLTGAAFSLREALSNDWVSIVERFNLPRSRINQLKDEGVPAMEAISTVLKEMGVDYTLVAEQGKTVAARLDKVKDSLVMMAGEATKPIFDRISRDLGKLGEMDFNKLGSDMAGVVSGAIVAFDEFVPKVQAVADAVGDYLGPKFGELWRVISQDLMPTLTAFWHDHLEPLMPVLGELLVGAIGLAVDAATFLIQAFDKIVEGIDWTIQKIQEGNPIIIGLAGVFGTLAVAMGFQAIFTALNAGFSFLTLVTIPAVKLAVGSLATFIATPVVFGAIVVGAALAALALVKNAANEAKRAINDAQAAAETAHNSNMSTLQMAQQKRKSGEWTEAEYQRIVKSISGRAAGGPVSAGSIYAVGDNPDGSFNKTTELFVPNTSGSIINSRDTQRLLSGLGGGGKSFTIQNLNVYPATREAGAGVFDALDQDSFLASRGFAVNRGAI